MNRQRFVPVVLLLLFLSGILIYGSGLNSYFVADDFRVISAVRDGGPFAIRTFEPGNFFRPLVSLSFFVDYSLWHLNPLGYHLTNLVLHIANTLLVIWLMWLLLLDSQMAIRYRQSLPALAGALFLVLPSHSEAVAWISGRTDLIAALFCLAAFCFAILDLRRPRSGTLVLSAGLYAVALLAKESVIPYPLVLGCYAFTRSGWILPGRGWQRPGNRALVTVLLSWLVLIAYFTVRYFMIGTLAGGYGDNIHLRFGPVLLIASMLSFVIRAITPPLPVSLMTAGVILAILMLGVLIAVNALPRLRQVPVLPAFLGVAFVLTVLPVLTVGISINDTQGERLVYLPSVFSTLFVVLLGARLLASARLFAPVMAALALIWVAGLSASMQNWNTAGALTRHILATMPVTEQTDRRLVILNLPDNLNGAYLFHAGFDDVLSLLDEDDMYSDVIVATSHTLKSDHDMVRVDYSGTQYTIHLQDPGASFGTGNVILSSVDPSPLVKLNLVTTSDVRLMLVNLDSDDVLLYYSGGQFIPLTTPAAVSNPHN